MAASNKYKYCAVKSQKRDMGGLMTEQERLTEASLTSGKEVEVRHNTLKVVREEWIDGKLYKVLSI